MIRLSSYCFLLFVSLSLSANSGNHISSFSNSNNNISTFAKNVITHVLIHELAHALIREFDLPVLGNEENMADSFATLYIVQTMPDKAEEIIHDRARSWILEASVEGNHNFLSEHAPKEMRAYQAICLLFGLDPKKYRKLPSWGIFSENDLRNCYDFAPEIARGWRRVLDQYTLPNDVPTREFRIIYGEGPMKEDMMKSGFLEEIGDIISRFDWHSRITLHFDHCDSDSWWSRSRRTIFLCDGYVSRFIEQGQH